MTPLSKITVRIEVTVDGAITDQGAHPVALASTFEVSTGDNPRYYGFEVQRAISAASAQALKSTSPFVDFGAATDG